MRAFFGLVLVALAIVAEGAARGGGGRRSGGRAGGNGFAPKRRQSTTRRDATATKDAPTDSKAPTHTHSTVYVQQGFGGGMGTALMGLSLMDAIIQEQRRAEMMRIQYEQQKELGKNSAELASLKAQLEAQEKKVSEMQSQADKEK